MKGTPLAAAAALFLLTGMAQAGESWLAPQKQTCNLEPGQDCNVEVTCPAGMPFVLAGGGGFPKISDDSHRLAMTMNLPVSDSSWRVRWRNMGTSAVEATVVVRTLCTDDGSAWGK